MLVHTPTLLLVLAAVSLLAAGSMWLEHQRSPGHPLRLWLGAFCSAAGLAVSALLLFSSNPPLAIVIPPVFSILMLALMYGGLAIHLGRPVPILAVLPVVPWIAAGVLRWYEAPLEETYFERRLALCLIYIAYGVATCRLVLQAERLTRTKKALIAAFALYGAFYALRLVTLTPVPVQEETALSEFWFTSAIYVSILLVTATGYLFPAVWRERSELSLREAAEGDPLTGLPNRRAFRERSEVILRDVDAAVLCLIDLDHFKVINDTCGHAVGDAVLCAFAAVMRSSLRPGETCGRLGGEEFGMLLRNETAESARHRLAVLSSAFRERAAAVGDLPFAATFSAGVVAARRGDDVDQMAMRADVALYRAKRTGRDRTEIAGDGPLDEQSPQADEVAAR